MRRFNFNVIEEQPMSEAPPNTSYSIAVDGLQQKRKAVNYENGEEKKKESDNKYIRK